MHAAASWRQQYFDSLTTGLARILVDELHTDTTVVVGEKTFKCHKSILSAMSPYFNAMFSSGMRESLSSLVEMKELDPDIFASILSYMYDGYIVLNDKNSQCILTAAAILQMDVLQKQCEEHLAKRIGLENCISTWRIAILHSCLNLEKAVFAYILSHFEELTENNEILCLESVEVISLVKDNNLKSPSEEYVCDAMVKWVEFDPSTRKQHIGDIMTHVRFPCTSPEYVINIKNNKYISADDRCLQAVDEAKNFHLLPARRHDYSSSLMSPRHPSNFEDVLVVLSGGETPKPPYIRSTNVLAYSFKTRFWYHLAALPFDPGIEFACCVYDNDIFVSGGGLYQESLLRYHSQKNKWTHVPAKLNHGRRRHAMVAVGNRLYVLGGYNSDRDDGDRVQKAVEEFDISVGEWDDVGFLEDAVSSVSASVLGEKIYMFGGERNDKTDTANIQCFNTKTNQTTIVAQLPIACKLSRAAVCDDIAYIVLFDGKVVMFRRNHAMQCIGNIKTFERVHFGLIHQRGSLVLLGGQEVRDGPNRPLCDAMTKFSIKNRTVVNMSDRIPSARLLDSCAKITIHNKFLVDEDGSNE